MERTRRFCDKCFLHPTYDVHEIVSICGSTLLVKLVRVPEGGDGREEEEKPGSKKGSADDSL